MSQTVTMRLPDETAEWIKTSARRASRSVSEWGATLFEEARRMSEFPQIEFRAFDGGRHPCLKGGVRIWKLIMVARDYMMDVEKTAAHFDMPAWKAQSAFNYFEAYPEEINSVIEDLRDMTYDKLARKLPQLEREIIPAPDEQA